MDGFKDITDTYEITGEIGSGGGGTVYKAYHKRLKKDVVIKKIHNDVKDIVNSRAEADILKNLRHSYLPQVFDFLEINGNVYTVMDFIPGKSFQQLLDEGVRFKQKQIIKWARQLAEALVYLHGQTPPILHSDIKPANIMLTPQGDICLIDFNISSVFSNGKAAPIGYSDGYSPPEQYPQLTTGKNRQPELRQSEAGMQSDPVKRHKPGSSNKTEEPIMHISASEDRNKDETEYFDRSEDDEDRTEYFDRSVNNEDKTEYFDRSEGDEDRTEYFDRSENDEDRTEDIERSGEDEYRTETNKPYSCMIDERSDIYSLGATLYHLLAGVRPAAPHKGVTPLSSYDIKISEGLLYIIGKAMQPRRERRFDSAARLHKALNQIYKLDRRYKRFMHQQELAVIGVLIILAASVLSLHYGRLAMREEKQELYSNYIADIEMFRENKDYEKLEEVYDKAAGLYPDRMDAYYHKALWLYEQGSYKECLEYVANDVLSNEDIICDSDQMLGDMYFILGSCYFELEDYNNASGAYKSAISIYDLNSEYYRDYAIALARMNKTEKASGVLDEALIKGLTEDNIYLVKAEIDLAESHYSEAEVNFLECLRLTDSYNIMNRAYIMCSKTYEKAGDKIEDADAKNINLLEEASVKLPVDLRLMVNTRLAEAYVRQGTLSGDNEYYRKAVDLFTDCISMGWDNYNIRNSLSMLYYMTGEYVMAYDELNYMLEKYGENYNTYKRLAYLEADVQSSKANEDRDYTIFREYYKKASELYHKDKKNDKGDAEMDFLDGIYREMLEGRWFDE